MLAAANLYAQMHGLPGSRDQTALRELLESLPLPVPQALAPISPSDLELAGASAEFGEVPGSGPLCCPPKAWPCSEPKLQKEDGAWGPCCQFILSQAL